jgi:hypothetical protein
MTALQVIDLSYNTFQVGIGTPTGTLCSSPFRSLGGTSYECHFFRMGPVFLLMLYGSTKQAVLHAVWYLTRPRPVFAKA